MTCDDCHQPINYCFYIDNEKWLKAVGKKEGHVCAHCILQKLGGLDWYIIWNEPTEIVRLNTLKNGERLMENFQDELESLINKHSQENESGTPDFILAAYLSDCLKAFNTAVQGRKRWYGERAGTNPGILPSTPEVASANPKDQHA